MGTAPFPGVKSGRGVTLTPYPFIVPWSWKGRAIPLLLLWAVRPVQSLSACARVTFTFIFNIECILPDTVCDVTYVVNVMPNKRNMQYYKHILIRFWQILGKILAEGVAKCLPVPISQLTPIRLQNMFKKQQGRQKKVTAVLTEGPSQNKHFLVIPYVFIDISTEPLSIVFLLYSNRWQSEYLSCNQLDWLQHFQTAYFLSCIRSLTHWGWVTQICVFNTRLSSLHNTLNYAIHRACLRMVMPTDVYRNLTSLWINL